ncbi:hypothetical protein ACJW8F_15700 [Plesiomonas shigelloides]|uniref:hypothetical protein n=1 Tax=Plesiomonas shigelloides TaxID=703 RepID=UPI00387EF2DD
MEATGDHLAGGFVVMGVSAWRYSAGKAAGELVANQQWQARWSERDAADASERAAREKAMRELENKR